MIVLIVGPSGVGKTTSYLTAQSQFPDVIFDHLDGLAARWAMQKGIIDRESVTFLNRTVNDAELFLSIGLLAIGRLEGENPRKHIVIDMGAGFHVARTAAQLHRICRVITITADVKVAFNRILQARSDPRTLDQYRQQEFAPNRVAVYSSAHHTIDSSRQSETETAEQLIETLRAVFDNPS